MNRNCCLLVSLVLYFSCCPSSILAGEQLPESKARKRPEAAAKQGPKWSVVVAHPSLSRDGLFLCQLGIREDVPVNLHLGISLVLHDNNRNKVGEMLLESIATHGERVAVFSLNRELIRHSYVQFHVYPNDARAETVKVYHGQQQTYRKVDGRLIREPIE